MKRKWCSHCNQGFFLSSSSDDFKPLSVDHSKPGRLKVGEGDEVNVSLPVVQVGGCSQTYIMYQEWMLKQNFNNTVLEWTGRRTLWKTTCTEFKTMWELLLVLVTHAVLASIPFERNILHCYYTHRVSMWLMSMLCASLTRQNQWTMLSSSEVPRSRVWRSVFWSSTRRPGRPFWRRSATPCNSRPSGTSSKVWEDITWCHLQMHTLVMKFRGSSIKGIGV